MDLGVLVDGKLDVSQQCALAESQLYPGLHQKKRGQQIEGSDPASLYSVLVRPHLEYCVQMWSTQYRRDLDLLEHVQRRATKMIQGMEHLSYEERLRELWLFNMEKRTAAFQCLKGGCKKGVTCRIRLYNPELGYISRNEKWKN